MPNTNLTRIYHDQNLALLASLSEQHTDLLKLGNKIDRVLKKITPLTPEQ
jgi:hypothetical protein